MIPLLPTPLLMLLCLVAATLLGAGIGACLWHLRIASRHARTLQALRESGARERRALDAIVARERESASVRHTEERRRTARERERAEQTIIRHEALAVHAREQARRIGLLEAEVLGLEGRHMQLQRDLASDRAGRWREASFARSPEPPRDDERLPVLNRRVGGVVADDALRPAGEELDIPALAESELPDAVDDLEFDLLDTRNLFDDADG